MAFTEIEIIEIEELCKVNPLIKKLWEEINLINQDAGAKFYKSLVECTNALSTEMDALHSGKYSKFRLLNGDSTEYKRVFQLLTNSKKIMEGLSYSSKAIKVKSNVKPTAEDPEAQSEEEMTSDSDMSFVDRAANKSKENGSSKRK